MQAGSVSKTNSQTGRVAEKHFTLPITSLASLAVSPTGNHLAVWEGSIEVRSGIFRFLFDLLPVPYSYSVARIVQAMHIDSSRRPPLDLRTQTGPRSRHSLRGMASVGLVHCRRGI